MFCEFLCRFFWKSFFQIKLGKHLVEREREKSKSFSAKKEEKER